MATSGLFALTGASSRPFSSTLDSFAAGSISTTEMLNSTTSATLGLIHPSSKKEFITTMTRWHAGGTVTITPDGLDLTSSSSIFTTASMSSALPSSLSSYLSSSPSTVAPESTFESSAKQQTMRESAAGTSSLSSSSSTVAPKSTSSASTKQRTTRKSTAGTSSLRSESSTVASGSTSKGKTRQKTTRQHTASTSHEKSSRSSLSSSATRAQPTEDRRQDAKYRIPGHSSCGIREKRMELIAQARMVAARGMNAVIVSYGAEEYVQSNEVLNDRISIALTTISQEVVDEEVTRDNDCEGLAFARDLAAVHQVALHRGITWARHHLTDKKIHKIDSEDENWLLWLIGMTDPRKFNHRDKVDKKQLKLDFDLLSSGVDMPELEGPPLPVDGPKPMPVPVVGPQPIPIPPVGPQPIPIPPVGPQPIPDPVQPQPQPTAPLPTNQPLQPTPKPKNPKPEPKPKNPKPSPKIHPGNCFKCNKPEQTWDNINGSVFQRGKKVIQSIMGRIFGTGPLVVESIAAPAAYKLINNLPDGTRIWQGSIYNKADQKIYDIRDYPELDPTQRNPKRFTRMINDPKFIENNRRLMDTPGWQHLRRMFRGTAQGPGPKFVKLDDLVVEGFMSMEHAADWGNTPPRALPEGQQAGWLEEDITTAKLALDYYQEMDRVAKWLEIEPEAEAFFHEKYEYIRGDGYMIRQSLRRDFGNPKDPEIKGKLDCGLLRFKVLDNNGFERPGEVYLSVRDVQRVSRWGNNWINPTNPGEVDTGVRFLRDADANILLDSYDVPILGQQMADGSVLLRTTKLVDSNDILRRVDVDLLHGSKLQDYPRPQPGQPGYGEPVPDRNLARVAEWGRPRPGTWQWEPYQGPLEGPSVAERDFNSTIDQRPAARNGGSSLIAVLDDSGQQIGELLHFNAQTGELKPLQDSSMIRKDGKDNSCALAKSRNITMSADSGCFPVPPPPPPPPPPKICEVHVVTNIVRKKKCSTTAQLSTSTLCHDEMPKDPSTTCKTFKSTMSDPNILKAPTTIAMSQCGLVYPNATTVSDAHCEPPECPSIIPRWTTPLPTVHETARPVKKKKNFPKWCDFIGEREPFNRPELGYIAATKKKNIPYGALAVATPTRDCLVIVQTETMKRPTCKHHKRWSTSTTHTETFCHDPIVTSSTKCETLTRELIQPSPKKGKKPRTDSVTFTLCDEAYPNKVQVTDKHVTTTVTLNATAPGITAPATTTTMVALWTTPLPTVHRDFKPRSVAPPEWHCPKRCPPRTWCLLGGEFCHRCSRCKEWNHY